MGGVNGGVWTVTSIGEFRQNMKSDVTRESTLNVSSRHDAELRT